MVENDAALRRLTAGNRKRLRWKQRYGGARHRLTRKMLEPFVAAGLARCARGAACRFSEGELGGFIQPGEPWDLGHPDGESAGGPEHAVCNRGAPHRNKTSREW